MDWIGLAADVLSWFVRDWLRWLLLMGALAVIAMFVIRAQRG